MRKNKSLLVSLLLLASLVIWGSSIPQNVSAIPNTNPEKVLPSQIVYNTTTTLTDPTYWDEDVIVNETVTGNGINIIVNASSDIIINITENGHLTLTNCQLNRTSDAGYFTILVYGTLEIHNTIVNESVSYGSITMYIYSGGTVTIDTNSKLVGMLIYDLGGTLTIQDTDFLNSSMILTDGTYTFSSLNFNGKPAAIGGGPYINETTYGAYIALGGTLELHNVTASTIIGDWLSDILLNISILEDFLGVYTSGMLEVYNTSFTPLSGYRAIYGDADIVVSGATFNGEIGIEIHSGTLTVDYSEFIGCAVGIFYELTDVVIDSTTFTGCGEGIEGYYGDIVVTDSTFEDTLFGAMLEFDTETATFTSNTFTGAGTMFGVYIAGGTNHYFGYNVFDEIMEEGVAIEVDVASGVTVTDNEFNGFFDAFIPYLADTITVMGNTFNHTWDGIFAILTYDMTISYNTFNIWTGDETGVFLYYCTMTTVSYNEFKIRNGGVGILPYQTNDYLYILDNEMYGTTGDEVGILPYTMWDVVDVVIAYNIIEDMEEGILIYGASGYTPEDFLMKGNVIGNMTYDGIAIIGGYNFIMADNVIYDCHEAGIWALMSNYTYVIHNEFYGSYNNIYFSESHHVVIERNYAHNAIWSGIWINSATDVKIMYNQLVNNKYGLFFDHVFDSHVEGNIIVYNQIGFQVQYSNNSEIIGNTFQNGVNVISLSSNNTWDMNRWSDYEGVDEDGDGYGDTPYVIDENNVDEHPVPIGYYRPVPTPPPAITTGDVLVGSTVLIAAIIIAAAALLGKRRV